MTPKQRGRIKKLQNDYLRYCEGYPSETGYANGMGEGYKIAIESEEVKGLVEVLESELKYCDTHCCTSSFKEALNKFYGHREKK